MDSKKVLGGFMWRFLERGAAQVITFLVTIILARLLSPVEYGTVSLIVVFTTILQVFVDSGLGNALIQKKNADYIDFSSVFYFNLFVCIVLYIVLFFSAPLIARFYALPELTSLTRVLGLTLIISGIRNIQQAYLSKNMLFKKLYYASISGTILSSLVGIALAYKGYGVWAIVWQQLSNVGFSTIILWILVKWRPTLTFSAFRLRGLLSFGWKLLVSSLIKTINEKVRQLLISRVYTRADLAYYNNGEYYPYALTTSINLSIDSVLLPALSSEQENREVVKAMTRRAMTISCYIIVPLMVSFAMCSESLVILVLTEKWLPCVPFIIIFCITNMFRPITTANLNAIKALGRSDLILKLEVIKIIISLSILFVTLKLGVVIIAIGQLISILLGQIVNASPNKYLLGYSYLEQIKDLVPIVLVAILMGATMFAIKFLGFNDVITLLLQIPIGLLVYFGLTSALRFESYIYVKEKVLHLLKYMK